MIDPDFEPIIDFTDPDDMEPEELRIEIAILAGVLAHKTTAAETSLALSNICAALERGGRA